MSLPWFKFTCKVVEKYKLRKSTTCLLNYFAIVLFLQDFPYNAGINRRVRGILQPNKTPKKQIEDFPQSLP